MSVAIICGKLGMERFIAFALGHADTTQVPRYSMGNDLEEAVALEQPDI
jgi:hypothetical protein